MGDGQAVMDLKRKVALIQEAEEPQEVARKSLAAEDVPTLTVPMARRLLPLLGLVVPEGKGMLDKSRSSLLGFLQGPVDQHEAKAPAVEPSSAQNSEILALKQQLDALQQRVVAQLASPAGPVRPVEEKCDEKSTMFAELCKSVDTLSLADPARSAGPKSVGSHGIPTSFPQPQTASLSLPQSVPLNGGRPFNNSVVVGRKDTIMAPSIHAQIVQVYPTVFAWASAVSWKGGQRNKREALNTALAIDAAVRKGYSLEEEFLEILLRRLASLHTADQSGSWDTAAELEIVPLDDSWIVPSAFLAKARAAATDRRKLRKEAAAQQAERKEAAFKRTPQQQHP
jgi:hypothetical protein